VRKNQHSAREGLSAVSFAWRPTLGPLRQPVHQPATSEKYQAPGATSKKEVSDRAFTQRKPSVTSENDRNGSNIGRFAPPNKLFCKVQTCWKSILAY